jgi:ferric-dicitrate binding protein FerR (iron transport regulator)
MTSDKKHIDQLLELYFSGTLEGKFGDIVRGWLVSDDSAAEKEAVLEGLFERLSADGPVFDEYARRSLAAIHDELGFTDRKVRSLEMRKSARRRVFGIIAGFAAAALIAGAIVTPALFDGAGSDASETTTIVAAVSSDRKVALPDGSVVNLKGGSSLTYNEAGFAEERTSEIDGEGFFVVAHDENHPFVVSSGDLRVTVLGTEFNVRSSASDDIAEVVVDSGRVKVASKVGEVTLNSSEKATVYRAQDMITVVKTGRGEISRLRGENLSFDDVSLDEALVQIGGYFGVGINISADLPAMEGLVLSLEDDATLDDALFILQTVAPVFDYSIEADVVTIKKR